MIFNQSNRQIISHIAKICLSLFKKTFWPSYYLLKLNFMKNYLCLGLLIFLFSCSTNKEKKLIVYTGKTQGTTFSIKFYASEDSTSLENGIDSILSDINHTASLWDSNSVISNVNRNQNTSVNNDFIKLYNISNEISKATDGCFDITVGNLVKVWGFSFKQKQEPDQDQIDSMLKFVGYRNLLLVNNKMVKKFPETAVDFNAIAQGYTVDLIAEYFLKNNCTDFIIEIGGEVRVNGTKANKELWVVGIDKPGEKETGNDGIQERVTLYNKSISTSGNYRKFFIKDGVKYSHTIDPKTGYPVHHSLLSVSVIANDCATADAYATAFMVMGVEKAKTFLLMNPGLEAYFIYHDSINGNQVYFTNKFFLQDK
jgi:thiamine biosynthesis lipoprotein